MIDRVLNDRFLGQEKQNGHHKVAPKHGVFWIRGYKVREELPLRSSLFEEVRRGQNSTGQNGRDWSKM